MDHIERLRTVCLALPEATEKEAWGAPTFRVRDKIFAMYDDHHHGAAHVSIWVKAGPGIQESVVEANPKHFFVPPYVGKSGWIGIHLDTKPDWKMVTRFIEDGYRLLAPKRALLVLDQGLNKSESPKEKAGPKSPARGRPAGAARRRKASP